MKIIETKVLPSELTIARTNKGWTQAELALRLSEYMGLKKPITGQSISFWETGKRFVSKKYIVPLADVLGVTIDSLIQNTPKPVAETAEAGFLISRENLYIYDGLPVYVQFNDYKHLNGWAICNYEKGVFIFKDKKIEIPNRLLDITLYSIQPSRAIPTNIDSNALTYPQLISREYVYVNMITDDKSIHNMYDGWYRHNENRTALINAEGLVLPYQGLNIAYSAHCPAGEHRF